REQGGDVRRVRRSAERPHLRRLGRRLLAVGQGLRLVGEELRVAVERRVGLLVRVGYPPGEQRVVPVVEGVPRPQGAAQAADGRRRLGRGGLRRRDAGGEFLLLE